ncbi:MAG: GHKL domain-containing protein [Candidatus Izemoplasmatales bacterium]|nr:GHKL domain-containing protein [Candidatus Izemoplasmatales bacterium]
MFIDILPDLLRGTTSTICLLLLLPVLSKGRLKTKNHIFIVIFVSTVISAISIPLYLAKNYTGVVYYSLFFYVLIIIGLKILLKETLYQWLFNSVTVLNIYAIVVIISYFISYLFPYQQYANTLIRLFLFALTFICFKQLIRPLYLEVSENWGAFLLPITGILINYIYILLSLGDVQSSMNENVIYFCFLTIVTAFTYIAIIASLKSLRVKFLLREENIKRRANEELLMSEIVSYESTVQSAKQTRHDIRHHNSILGEYLQSGDMDGAKNYLQLYDDNIQESSLKEFSKNPIANAVFRVYERRAREYKIDFVIQSQADALLSNQFSDIGSVLSNIFENALESCKQCLTQEKYIYYSSIEQNGCILIEIKNSVEGDLTFINGIPVTTKSGGGTGLLSVKSIIEKQQGMLAFSQEKNFFFTRIILPLQL